MDWAADSAHALSSNNLLCFPGRFGANALGPPPPPRSYGQYTSLTAPVGGIDVTDRLSLANSGTTGLNKMLSRTIPNKSGAALKQEDWSTAQNNWAPTTTFGYENAATTYTAPASNYEVRSGPPLFYETPNGYQPPQYRMPSSHPMNPGNQSSAGYSQFRDADGVLDNGHYPQTHSPEENAVVGHHDAGHMPGFDLAPFQSSASFVTGRPDHTALRYGTAGSNALPYASSGPEALHYQ